MRAAPLFLVTLLLLPACDSDSFSSRDSAAAGSDLDPSPDAPGVKKDAHVMADKALPTPKLDSACGGQNIPIVLTKKGDVPDLHLVVDRSGSMMLPVDLFDLTKGFKWDVMKKVLISLVTTYKGNIRFALTLFPGSTSDECSVGKIDVPLQTGNEPAIQSKLTGAGPTGSTPTHTTLAAVNTYLQGVPVAKGGRYVMLATDGMPNCGATPDADTSKETLAEVQKLYAAGVKVFVVGFGSIVAANPSLLNQLAQAGGAVNPKGPQKFYPASNEKELKDALFTIAGGLIPPPCTYALTSQPQDANKVTVTFDGVAVPRSMSSTDGWNYSSGGTEITFYGSYCTKLQQGQVKDVKFLFGCKGPVIN